MKLLKLKKIYKDIPLMTDVNCAWTYEEVVEKENF